MGDSCDPDRAEVGHYMFALARDDWTASGLHWQAQVGFGGSR